MKKLIVILNVLALAVVIALNYLSNTGIFNGNTMGSVSAEYENLFTPAGYAFSIWGLIYLSLAGFVYYSSGKAFGRNEDRVLRSTSWWFVISCIANCAWIASWLNLYTGLSVLVMTVLFISLLAIVINNRVGMERRASTREKFFVWIPFSLYSGWISVALIANVSAWLTKIEWNGWGLSDASWAIIMIAVATIIHLYMVWGRSMWVFALAGAWGLAAIGADNIGTSQAIAYIAFIASGLLVINSLMNGLRGNTSRENVYLSTPG